MNEQPRYAIVSAGCENQSMAETNAAEAAEIKKRSVVIAGHRTSISLENAFWDALRDLATARDLSVNQLVTEIDRGRRGNLSSAIRTYVLLARGTANG